MLYLSIQDMSVINAFDLFICRDLKPENILLDDNGKNSVYIFDKWAMSWETCLCHMWTTKAQISLHIRAVGSAPLLFAA